MDKITTVRRAIRASLKIKEYKNLKKLRILLEIGLIKNGLSKHSLSIIDTDLDKKIEILTRYVKNKVYDLIYTGQSPHLNTEKKIFGEYQEIDGLKFIDEKSIYYSIGYISTYDLNNGYIQFTELIKESIGQLKITHHILDLHTGEFTIMPEKLVEKPVITSEFRRQTNN
jgi:hypothetical protein